MPYNVSLIEFANFAPSEGKTWDWLALAGSRVSAAARKAFRGSQSSEIEIDGAPQKTTKSCYAEPQLTASCT